MAKQKRTTIGREDLENLWALSHMLCGLLDPGTPGAEFANRLQSAYSRALEMHTILSARLAKVKKQEVIAH